MYLVALDLASHMSDAAATVPGYYTPMIWIMSSHISLSREPYELKNPRHFLGYG